MTTPDIDSLLAPCAEAPPCGPNLEYDLGFAQIEKAASRIPAQEYGGHSTPAQEPKWPEALELAQAFLARSKDVRVAVQMARARMHIEGLPALPASLALLRNLLERYWDGVHPQLEDGGDTTMRVNALAALSSADAFLADLRDAALVSSREHGRLTVRQVEVALGRLPAPPAEEPPTLEQVRAQLADAIAAGNPSQQALAEALNTLSAIRTLFAERAGNGPQPDFKPLADVLGRLKAVCDEAAPDAAAATVSPDGADARPVAAAPPASGEIRSRDDAVRLLERVCGYLERAEPANPAPLLIRRAQRLMTKSFLEIVQDLMPDSLSTLERVAGKTESPAK